MSEFSDELVILLTEPEEENEDFSSVLSSLPSLSSVYNKNENESKCVGIVFGDKFIPTKPKVGKEWMKKSVRGEAGMDGVAGNKLSVNEISILVVRYWAPRECLC